MEAGSEEEGGGCNEEAEDGGHAYSTGMSGVTAASLM